MSDTQTQAVFDEIRDWFFEGYVPTWVAAGAGTKADPRSVLDYWGVPMHAANPETNRWLMTEEEVLGLLSEIQKPLKTQRYSHTKVLDRHMTFYHDSAASADVIWSRRRADEVEIERRAVHFEIRAVDSGWRIISLASLHTDKTRLADVFAD